MIGSQKYISIKRFDQKQLYNRANTLWKRNEKLILLEQVPDEKLPWLLQQWQILTAADPVGQSMCQQKLFVPLENGRYMQYDAFGVSCGEVTIPRS